MQRYEKFSSIRKERSGKRRYATMYYPKARVKSSDRYIVAKKNTRLDLLAFEEYGDTRKWVIIAKANKLHNGTIRVPVGRRLRIPNISDSEIESDFRNKQF